MGKEPGHGDRVSGRGEKAERSEEPAGKGAWGGGHRTKRCSKIKTGRWWGFREARAGLGQRELERQRRSPTLVYGNHHLWGCWERQILDGRRAG